MAESAGSPGISAAEAKTSIDAMLEILKTKGRQEVGELAIALGKSYDLVERWARVLEEGGVVTIKHELGKVYVEPTTAITPEREVGLREKTQQAILEEKIGATERELRLYSNLVRDLNKELVKSESVTKASTAFNKLSELNKHYRELENSEKHLDTMKQNAQQSFQQMVQQADAALSKISALDTDAAITKAKRIAALYQEARMLMEDHQRQIRQIADARLEQMQKLLAELDHDADVAARAQAQTRQVANQMKLAAQQIDRQRKLFIDGFEELNLMMAQKTELITTMSEEIRNEVQQITSNASEAVKLSQRYSELVDGIKMTQRMIDESSNEVKKLREQYNKAVVSKQGKIKKAETIEALSQSYIQTSQKTSKIRDSIAQLSPEERRIGYAERDKDKEKKQDKKNDDKK